MRILQDTKKQRSFTKIYWQLGRKALLKSAQPVLSRAEIVYPEDLKRMTRSLLVAGEMESYLNTLCFHTGSTFAIDTVKRIMSRKDEQQDLWERLYKKYAAERTDKVLGVILDTEAENINRIIDRYVLEGTNEGLSIQKIAERMRSSLSGDMVEMQTWEAERIARTEVIGASNQASYQGALSTGLDIKKYWMTSGLPGVRSTHREYEAMGDQSMDYEYAPGLKVPGDPSGSAEEIINCRCTHGFNVD